MFESIAIEISKYLRSFSNKKKNPKKSLFQNKALVIYDDIDYIGSEKIIEAICNDLDFKIIKIDDLENKKILRFNKISEATQSKRITSVSDILTLKIDVLERILNNNSKKFHSFFDFENLSNSNKKNLCINLNNQNNFNNITNNISSNASKEITDFYRSDITKEKEIFNAIKHNMMKFVNNKKTLILISDTFSNLEESKLYISSITSKLSESKIPIIILTSKKNINFNFR